MKMRHASAIPSSRTFSARGAESCGLRGALTHRPNHVGCARVAVGLLLLACGAKFSFAQEFAPREFEARAARHERHAGTGGAEMRAGRNARAGHDHQHHHQTNTTTAIPTNKKPTSTTTPHTDPTTNTHTATT